MDRVQDALWEALWVVGPAVLGYLFGVLKRKMKTDLYKKIMRFNVKEPADSPLKIITANTEQHDDQELVIYGFVFEYRAAGELGATLAKLYGPRYRISTTMSKRNFDNYTRGQLDQDLIVIGGPFHNSVTREFFRRMGDSMPFHYDADATLVYTGPGGEQHFTAKEMQDYYGEDHALIMNVKNPINPDKRVIFISGCRSIGCYGGAIFLSQQLKELKGIVKDDEYAVVVYCSGGKEDLDSRPKFCEYFPLHITYTE